MELSRWMAVAGPRSSVPLPLLPARIDMPHLRERFHRPEEESGPPPLRDVTADRPADLSLEELLAQGGPSLELLKAALQASLASDDPPRSLGALFDTLAPDLRRPVEVLGLLHLATNIEGLDSSGEDREPYRTIRRDGSKRDLLVPLILPAQRQPAEPSEEVA